MHTPLYEKRMYEAVRRSPAEAAMHQLAVKAAEHPKPKPKPKPPPPPRPPRPPARPRGL